VIIGSLLRSPRVLRKGFNLPHRRGEERDLALGVSHGHGHGACPPCDRLFQGLRPLWVPASPHDALHVNLFGLRPRHDQMWLILHHSQDGGLLCSIFSRRFLISIMERGRYAPDPRHVCLILFCFRAYIFAAGPDDSPRS
jgi:hypothetical protein